MGIGAVALLLCLFVPPCDAEADLLELTATVRDFRSSHPDFENVISSDPGIVLEWLGSDGKPIYAGEEGNPTTHGSESFDQWYRDVPGTNMRRSLTIALQRSPEDPRFYTYHSSSFFPIDGELFGDEGYPHNFHFTLEIHARFQYHGGEVFTFTGDDDLWVFINNRLAIDLGGVHGPMSDTVSLDEQAEALEIVPGGTYDFALFFAERHTTGSNCKITTSLEFSQEAATDTQRKLTDVVEEIVSHLETAEPGSIVFSGFRDRYESTSVLEHELNEATAARVAELESFQVVEPAALDRALREELYRRSDLVDTGVAIRIGRMLRANYVITGTIIEMSASVLVFARILDAGTGEVLVTSQANVPREKTIEESDAD